MSEEKKREEKKKEKWNRKKLCTEKEMLRETKKGTKSNWKKERTMYLGKKKVLNERKILT